MYSYIVLICNVIFFHAIIQAQTVTVTYNSSGSYNAVVPTGATDVKAEAWGGGGGGGGAYYGGYGGSSSKAGGGGGGAYVVKTFGGNGGTDISVSVGGGGAAGRGELTAGLGSMYAGSAGGASACTYNSVNVIANGGGGGDYANYGWTGHDRKSSGNGGAGGTAVGGDGNSCSGTSGASGDGGGYGGGACNGGGNTGSMSDDKNGSTGTEPGGGGSGGRSYYKARIWDLSTGKNWSGGAGRDGKLIITFNYSIPTPSITGSAARVVCQGDSITFSVDNPIADGGVTYQWRKNGVNIDGATGTSFTVANINTSHEGKYSVVAIVNYAFVGATTISGDNTDNSAKKVSGTSSPSAEVTITIGPYYDLAITSEGPGKAWFLNPGSPDDQSITTLKSLCGTTIYPQIDTTLYGLYYHFAGYYKVTGEFSEFLSSDPKYTFKSSENTTIKAMFDTNLHRVAFIPVREDGTPAPELGSTTGSGFYKHFHPVEGTATANEYCEFLRWRDSVSKEIVSPSIESLNGDITYEAVFREITHNVTTSVDVAARGTTLGDSAYSKFVITELGQVEAIPSTGFTFKRWDITVDGTLQDTIITDNPYIFIQNDRILNDYHFTAIFDTSVYTVSANNPNGSVSGTGNYLHGKTVTLKARPDSGYHFVRWQVNGLQVSTDSVLTFEVLQDTLFTAVFEVNKYLIMVSVSPAEYGEYAQDADMSGMYKHFAEFDMKAVPYSGFEFRYWIINGDTVYAGAEYSIKIDGAKTIKGIFTPVRKRMTVTAEPNTYGTVQGDGIYEHGSSVEASAAPEYGFSFLYFTNSLNDTVYDNPIIIPSLEHDTSFTAYFERNEYTVEAFAAAGGIVSLEALDSGINTKKYPYKSSVVVYAQNDSNHFFVNWTDRNGNIVSEQNPLSIVVEKDTFYKANFERKSYFISVSIIPENMATATGQGTYYALDTAVLTVSLTPAINFTGWSENGADIFETKDTLRIVVRENKNYYAVFSLVPFSLTVLTNDPERGTALGSGQYYVGGNTRIMAQPLYGYDFKCWLRDGDTLSTAKTFYPAIRAQDDTVTAIFVQHEFTLTIKDGNNITVRKVPYRESTVVRTEIPYGFDFAGWKTSSGMISAETEFQVTVVCDTLFETVYTPKQYDITTSVAGVGQTVGAGEYDYGTEVVLTAVSVSDKYVFSHWEDEDGVKAGTDAELKLTVAGNAGYTAFFVPVPVAITLHSKMADGNVFASQTINKKCFDTVNISAHEYNGLSFKEWQDKSGVSIANSNELLINLLGDTVLYAIYDSTQYSLYLSVSPENSGIATVGSDIYFYGQNAVLHAESNYGYTFKNYVKKDGTVVSYTADCLFTVNSSDTIIAQFTPNTYKVTVYSAQAQLGSVKGSKNALYGSTADIKAWAIADGHEFSAWKDSNGNIISENAEISVLVERDTVLYAHFVPSEFLLKVLCAGGEGTVSIDSNDEQQEIISPYMSVHTINAIPDTGYHFAGWQEIMMGVISTSAQTEITLNKDRTIEAVFLPNVYDISISWSTYGDVDIWPSGVGVYAHGSTASIRIEVPKGYDFIAWTLDGDTLSKEPSFEIIVTRDMRLFAVFELRGHNIVIEENIPGAALTLTGGGIYDYNSNAVLKAEPNLDYLFSHWENKGVRISSLPEFSFRVTGDDTVTAVFTPLKYSVNAAVNILEAGTLSFGLNTFDLGDTVNIFATENAHYHFLYWTENDEVVCSEKTYSFIATRDRNLVAHFEINRYKIILFSSPDNIATLTGSGTYNALSTTVVEAGTAIGYDFAGWIDENGDTLTSENTLSFEISRDVVFMALYNSNFVTINVVAEEGGRVMGGGKVLKGTDTSVVAIPYEGYAFDYWTNDRNETVSRQSEMRFTVERDATYTAHFKENVELTAKLIVYPNPAKTYLNVLSDREGVIQIIDTRGDVLYDVEMADYSATLNVSWLAAGIYYYRFIPDDGKVVTGKFIKLKY